jgi:hypothetical protein
LCCLLCKIDESAWEDPWFGQDILNAIYAGDGQGLSCSDEEQTLAARPDNFCDSSAHFSLYAAQGLANCPRARPYSGLHKKPRHVEYYEEDDQIECGIYLCNGNGRCDSSRTQCVCFGDYWGDSCQFGKVLKV